MSDNATKPAPAQVVYTSSPFTSPLILGSLATTLVTVLVGWLGSKGIHMLDDPTTQLQLVTYIGLALTAAAHWVWPHKDGKLALAANFSTPAPQDLPVGSSLVNVPVAEAARRGLEVYVRPANDLAEMVRVAEVSAAVASAAETFKKGIATPVTVNVTPAGKPNEAVLVSREEARAAPAVPVGVPPSPAPKVA